jgi:cullin 3
MSDKKRGIILPFKQAPHMGVEAAGKSIEQLKQAIHKIYNLEASSLSFEELYRTAYNLVLAKHGDLLYESVKQTITEHTDSLADSLTEVSDNTLLSELWKMWSASKQSLMMIRDFLMFLDRNYLMTHNRPILYQCGLTIFRDRTVSRFELSHRLTELLVSYVRKERQGELIDREVMRDILKMLVELGISSDNTYSHIFEKPFLEETRQFYQREAMELLATYDCSNYIIEAERRIQEEAERLEGYLAPFTEGALMYIVNDCFIVQHSKTLVEMENSGCMRMILNSNLEDLGRMYNLFSRVPTCLKEIGDAVGKYVIGEGRALIGDPELKKHPEHLVNAMLELREKFNIILLNSFKRDSVLENTIRTSFEAVVNVSTRIAQCLAMYIDALFKKEVRGMREEVLEQRLNNCLELFRYISDKDIFENYYKQSLARRLINNRSLSEEAERLMITKLKAECGYQFTAKLEGMFKDMMISKTVSAEFPKLKSVVLDIRVLTTGFWPNEAVELPVLPSPLYQITESFSSWYTTKYPGRRITWKTSLGTVELRTEIGGQKHELIMSTFQAAILLSFNSAERLTVSEIENILRVTGHNFSKHLLGLLKVGLLLKNSPGKDLPPGASLSVNSQFTSKMFRVKVPVVSSKEHDAKVIEGVPDSVEDDRRHLIEAAIVRTLKTRRTIEHNALMTEVIRQLSTRFTPEPKTIKQRIEGLIEREYMDRDSANPRLYTYLA